MLQPKGTAIVLPPELMRSAFSSSIIGQFFAEYLPGGRVSSPLAALKNGGEGFITLAEEMQPSSRPIELIMLSVSLSTVGKRDGNVEMMEAGLKYHTLALQQTSEMMKRAWAPDNRAAVKVIARGLALFEVITPSRANHDCYSRLI